MLLSPKISAYQSPSRTAMFRRNGSSRPENIPNSANSMDHRRILFRFAASALASRGRRAALIYFAAQAMDEHVHDIGLRIEAIIKNVLEDHCLGHRPIGMAHEILQQGVLARLQLDQFAATPDFASNEVKCEIANGQTRWFGRLGRAPNERLNTRKQLRKGERLGKIIIATRLQAFYAVVNGGLGAEDQDRHLQSFGAELLDQAQAVQF